MNGIPTLLSSSFVIQDFLSIVIVLPDWLYGLSMIDTEFHKNSVCCCSPGINRLVLELLRVRFFLESAVLNGALSLFAAIQGLGGIWLCTASLASNVADWVMMSWGFWCMSSSTNILGILSSARTINGGYFFKTINK